MSMLTAWKLDTPDGAGEALSKLEKLHHQLLINLHDAAMVSWEVGGKKPSTQAPRSLRPGGLTLPPRFLSRPRKETAR